MTTVSMAQQLPQHADEASAAPRVTAEWALWGKEGKEPAYRVLRCSAGVFGSDDFHDLITRYTSGVKEELPQYTVCWIPVGEEGEEGEEGQGYLAVGIHEHADPDPRRSGGRARTAGGREIEFVRLFCARYTELAEHKVRYTDLVEVVREEQLPAGPTKPILAELPEPEQRRLSGPLARLAENVATLLLTTRPVCVLGAEAATAWDRLFFIDEVMSLLPYGLRATLSASTWASSTAQDLKLRLFFSNAMRDDGGRTHYVNWGAPGELKLPADDAAPLLYWNWLRNLGSHAESVLSDDKDAKVPVRFDRAEIRQMVATLPMDRPVADTLHELADKLRHGDRAAVSAAVGRLKRFLVRGLAPAERRVYRQMIAELGLLKDHPRLHHSTKASVYRVLLRLAFETPLSYESFCDIEDAAGGPPRGILRSVMLTEFRFSTVLPWLLTVKSEAGFTDEELMENLAEQALPATGPLKTLQRDIGEVRASSHRAIMYDFAVRYLCAYAEEPRAELARRGYLAETLEAVFPGDQRAQRARLHGVLRFVYGEELSRGQIRELFADPDLHPTPAFEAAVARMAASPRAWQFISEQAAFARHRPPRYGNEVLVRQHGNEASVRKRARQRRSRQHPDTIWAFPRWTVYLFAGAILAMLIAAGLLLLTNAH